MKKITPISIDGVQTCTERTIPFGMFGQRAAKATNGVGGLRAVSWIATEDNDENGKRTHKIVVTLANVGNPGKGCGILSSEVIFIVKRNTYTKCHSAMLQLLFERNVAVILPKKGDE